MENEELKKELEKTKEVLSTLICWLSTEIGSASAEKLLDQLEN